MIKFDLHTHTTYSDGGLLPEELLLRAVEKGVDYLAITDHDTLDGVLAAVDHLSTRSSSQDLLPVCLIPGIELSTTWCNKDIHVLGLDLSLHSLTLNQLIEEQKKKREIRARLMADKLEKALLKPIFDEVVALAAGAPITRSHFAKWLINNGYASDYGKVFQKYLSKGKTGYVAPQWCSLADAIQAIQAAGGVAVLAHPLGYALSPKWVRRLVVDFKNAGGDGLEVSNCQLSPADRQKLANYAKEYQLLASVGSDFHHPMPWIELGRNLWLPDDLMPIWCRFEFVEKL